MPPAVERLSALRFDLAFGRNLLAGHRPISAALPEGALADPAAYARFAVAEPIALEGALRLLPAGRQYQPSAFWNRLRLASSGHGDLGAAAIPIEIAMPNSFVAGPGAPPGQSPALRNWLWPFAVATELSATAAHPPATLGDVGTTADKLLGGIGLSRAGAADQGSALFKAQRARLAAALWPGPKKPQTSLVWTDITVLTVVARAERSPLAFGRWLDIDGANLFAALFGRPVAVGEFAALCKQVTMVPLQRQSFVLFKFDANRARAVLYLTQGGRDDKRPWARCLSRNVAHLVMTALALARLWRETHDDKQLAAQADAAAAVLKELETAYNNSVTSPLFANHAGIAAALAEPAPAAGARPGG